MTWIWLEKILGKMPVIPSLTLILLRRPRALPNNLTKPNLKLNRQIFQTQTTSMITKGRQDLLAHSIMSCLGIIPFLQLQESKLEKLWLHSSANGITNAILKSYGLCKQREILLNTILLSTKLSRLRKTLNVWASSNSWSNSNRNV